VKDFSMTEYLFASPQDSQVEDEPTEKPTPVGDPPSDAPAETPAEPTPVVNT
jgi:hypothetical protein